MEKTTRTISELFPNLHSKTIATLGTVITVITYIICESGLI